MDEQTTEMPTLTISEYLREHNYSHDPRDAHPIDRDIIETVCDSKMGPILIEEDLTAIQAVAEREILPYNSDVERWVTRYPQTEGVDLFPVENGRDRNGPLHYYQAQSATFYDLLSMVHEQYDHYVQVEDIEDIVEVHTRQYLRDVHGYEGDFGGQVPNDSIDKMREPTLCNAHNDPTPYEGVIDADSRPDNANYGFIDARGLVIEEGTHLLDDEEQHSVGTLACRLDDVELQGDESWTEDGAVHYLTQNYVCDEERALKAFERYQSVQEE